MSSPSSHIVVLGDLVRSRQIQDRRAVAEDIEAALQAMSGSWLPEEAWVAAPATVKGMDEIAGVLGSPEHAFDFLTYMNQEIWPHRIRVAVARGAIDVGLNRSPADVASLDGPAFHLAAQGMARAKRQDLPFAWEPLRQGADGEDPRSRAARELVENSARVHAALMAEWTETSHARLLARIASEVRIGGKKPTQKELAKEFGVSDQAYSASLKQAHAREMIALQQSIRTFLKEWRLG